jgi:hypothetical protein
VTGSSWRVSGAGGSPNRETPGRVGAAATKSGRPSTAGWAGPGERDGTVYERNRCCKASSSQTSSNPVDVGWVAVHVRAALKVAARRTPGRVRVSGLGGHGEGLRRSRDEAAGAKPGASPVDRNAVNVGTAQISVPAVVPASHGTGDRRVVSQRGCAGRSRRSTPSPGKPVTWGRAAVC